MRKLNAFIYTLLLIAATGCSTGYKTAIVKTRNVTGAGTTHLPLLVDLVVDDYRVNGTFSCKVDFGLEYAKTQAVAAALKNANADILFEPHYLIENTGSFYNVEVSGHPARYKNFRTPWADVAPVSAPVANEDEPAPKPVVKSTPPVTRQPAPKPAEKPAPVKAEPVAVYQPAPTVTEKAVVKDEPVEEKTLAPAATTNPTNNDQDIVYHKVVAGETVSSIVQQFGITLAEFNRWNDLPDGVSPGDNVIVKFKTAKKTAAPAEVSSPKPAAQPKTTTDGGIKYHVLASGETLYHLSVVYHCTVAQIREWNNLTSNDVPVGKNLIVGK